MPLNQFDYWRMPFHRFEMEFVCGSVTECMCDRKRTFIVHLNWLFSHWIDVKLIKLRICISFNVNGFGISLQNIQLNQHDVESVTDLRFKLTKTRAIAAVLFSLSLCTIRNNYRVHMVLLWWHRIIVHIAHKIPWAN